MPKLMPPIHSRFKPGVSGNPGGRPKLPEDLKMIRELSQEEVRRIFAKYARMTKNQIQEAIQSIEIPMVDLAVASILAMAAKEGDYARLSFILDRTIGRVGTDDADGGDPFKDMPTDELIKLVKEKLPELEAG